MSSCQSSLGASFAEQGVEAGDDDTLEAVTEDDDAPRPRPRPGKGEDTTADDDAVGDDAPRPADDAADDDVGDDAAGADDDVSNADDDAVADDDTAMDDDVAADDSADDDTTADDDAPALDDDIADDDTSADDATALDDDTADDDATSDDDVAPVCGNAVVEAPETCDDGVNDGSGASCNPDCTTVSAAGRCGDGVVGAGEACDDANDFDRDGCARDCTVWFDRDFTRRTRLDLQNSTSVSLSDFPAMITVDGSSADLVELGEGSPCFVASDNATILSVERDSVDSALYWVKVPLLAAGGSAVWMYYGGSDSDGCGTGSTAWRSDYRAVFHMNDERDSSNYDHAMTDTGTTDTAGVIGRARIFGDGETLESEPDINLHLSSDLTISAWVNFSTLSSGTYRNSIVTYGDSGFVFDENFQYGFYMTSDTSLFSYWALDDSTTVQNTSSATTGMPLGEFHHLAMVRDTAAGVMRFYYDGAEVGTAQDYDALPNGGDLSHLVVGGNAAGSSYNMSGALDELRIFAGAASSEWIATEYASMASGIATPVMDP